MAPKKSKILKTSQSKIKPQKLYIKILKKVTNLNSEKFLQNVRYLKSMKNIKTSLKKLFFLTKNNFFSFLLRLSSSQKGSCLNFLDLYKLCPKNRIFFISKTNQTLLWGPSLTSFLNFKIMFLLSAWKLPRLYGSK